MRNKKKPKQNVKSAIKSFRLAPMDIKKIKAYSKFKKITASEAIRQALNSLEIAY